MRHGHLPDREIMTSIGPVAVRCPRVRDRGGEGCERIRFSSTILPPYARRSKSLEVLIPILYLKGISTGDFEDALIALLGRDAAGSRPRPLDASRRPGPKSTRAGANATPRPNATSTSGSTAFTCRPVWKTLRNAC